MRIVIVGGGIAGVCCLDELTRILKEDSVTLVAASNVLKASFGTIIDSIGWLLSHVSQLEKGKEHCVDLKGVGKVTRLTDRIEDFEIVKKSPHAFSFKNLTFVRGIVRELDTTNKELVLTDGRSINYDKLCICSGARPKVLYDSPHVLSLRDMHSVEILRKRLGHAQSVMIVGNGGIALDLMSCLRGYKLIWVMKHAHAGEAFFDADTADFLLGEFSKMKASTRTSSQLTTETESSSAVTSSGTSSHDCLGEALGPNWIDRISLNSVGDAELSTVITESDCLVQSIKECPNDAGHSLQVGLTNDHQYEVDVIIAAVGVDPYLPWVPSHIQRGKDGGLLIDQNMRTSDADIYAAGDCCTVDWGDDQSHHWFQMRLWSQARNMGTHAARCMTETDNDAGMIFEIFTHVTHLLNQKVILLGRYDLEADPENDRIVYKRKLEIEGEQCFAKIVLQNGRLQGAVLIGNTELEGTMENLILDKLDVSRFGEDLLHPDIDHVFD